MRQIPKAAVLFSNQAIPDTIDNAIPGLGLHQNEKMRLRAN
jgi:hypothetical protein